MSYLKKYADALKAELDKKNKIIEAIEELMENGSFQAGESCKMPAVYCDDIRKIIKRKRT